MSAVQPSCKQTLMMNRRTQRVLWPDATAYPVQLVDVCPRRHQQLHHRGVPLTTCKYQSCAPILVDGSTPYFIDAKVINTSEELTAL
jgi:hypothetical protein